MFSKTISKAIKAFNNINSFIENLSSKIMKYIENKNNVPPEIHEEILSYLLKSTKNSEFYFLARLIDSKENLREKLNNGFWFRGNERYLQTTFWDETDSKDYTYKIAFEITSEQNYFLTPCIQISCKDTKDLAFYSNLAKHLKCTQFKNRNNKKVNVWRKYYGKTKYIDALDEFIKNDIPEINDFIKKNKFKINHVTKEKHEKSMALVDKYRKN